LIDADSGCVGRQNGDGYRIGVLLIAIRWCHFIEVIVARGQLADRHLTVGICYQIIGTGNDVSRRVPQLIRGARENVTGAGILLGQGDRVRIVDLG